MKPIKTLGHTDYDDFAMDALIVWEYILEKPFTTPFQKGVEAFREMEGVFATRQWVIDTSVQIQLGFRDAFAVRNEHVAESGIAYDFEWLPSLLEDAYQYFCVTLDGAIEEFTKSHMRSFAKSHYLDTLQLDRSDVTFNQIREEINDVS